MTKGFKLLLTMFLLLAGTIGYSQGPVTIGGLDFDFKSPKTYELEPIRIEGADNYDHNAIRLIAGLKQGTKITIPGETITKALKNLWDEGIFSDVEINAEKEVAGVLYIVIKLTPRPKLSRFKFTGIKKRDIDKIREEVSLFSGKTITENLVFATESKIRGYFREKGFYSVSVTIDRVQDTLITNSEIFKINVDRGERVKIGELNIEGNESVASWKLRLAMKDTKQKAFWRFFKRSKYSESAYRRDKEAMMGKFTKVGLRDAEIAFDTVYLADRKKMNMNNSY